MEQSALGLGGDVPMDEFYGGETALNVGGRGGGRGGRAPRGGMASAQ